MTVDHERVTMFPEVLAPGLGRAIVLLFVIEKSYETFTEPS